MLNKDTAPGLSVGFWALTDQCVVSLGTFLTNLLLARNLPPAEYGVYAVLLATFFFLNAIHASVITYPLSVEGAAAPSVRKYAGGALALTLVLAVPLSIGLVVAAALAGRVFLAGWALAALVAWQAQETLRRSLMARLNYRSAIWGDAISYLGQAGLVALLLGRGQVTIEIVLVIMATTSALAATVQGIQIGVRSANFGDGVTLLSRFWNLGRWVLVSNFMGAFSISAYYWVLAYFHDAKEAAAFQAVVTVLGISHPVLFGLGNVLVPITGRASALGGKAAAWGYARRHGLQAGAVVMPYFALLIVWPAGALAFFYGEASVYRALELPLRILAISYALMFVAQVVGGFLSGLKRTWAVFVIQSWATSSTVLVGLPLTGYVGVVGACAGHVMLNLVKAALGSVYAKDVKHSDDGSLYQNTSNVVASCRSSL